jgi:hypothetical protein
MTSALQPLLEPHQHLSRADSFDVETVVHIVVPVHNEEVDLGPSVARLDAFLSEHFP